jgi:hypothetical protein
MFFIFHFTYQIIIYTLFYLCIHSKHLYLFVFFVGGLSYSDFSLAMKYDFAFINITQA